MRPLSSSKIRRRHRTRHRSVQWQPAVLSRPRNYRLGLLTYWGDVSQRLTTPIGPCPRDPKAKTYKTPLLVYGRALLALCKRETPAAWIRRIGASSDALHRLGGSLDLEEGFSNDWLQPTSTYDPEQEDLGCFFALPKESFPGHLDHFGNFYGGNLNENVALMWIDK
ncbi:hypothetical protein Taro_032490 [Colocasia esculenta]|uniref:Uncharacterized protein n=1 Tax=Colocasia esculenta TaxID=4460 RepID=A0A843VSS2_COLES|nr:hypothetical protein [Colocasia esculenta]